MTEERKMWFKDKEFRSDGESVVVEVWRLDLSRPRFRIQVSCAGRDDRNFRAFPVYITVDEGTVKADHDLSVGALETLVEEARLYVEAEVQRLRDEWMTKKDRMQRNSRKRTRTNGRHDAS